MNVLHTQHAEDAARHMQGLFSPELCYNLYLSGGSSISLLAELDNLLSLQQKKQINLLQVDERYGKPNHAHANWQQICKAVDVTAYKSTEPILKEVLEATATQQRYDNITEQALNSSSIDIAILGVGTDAHIAGMKPMDAATFNKLFESGYIAHYDWSDFQRITQTIQAIQHMDHVVVFAKGSAKKNVIDSLQTDRPEHESPIHSLRAHKSATLYYVE